MTAENPGTTGSPENPGNTEYDGMDALMAAILDEPLPAAARRDPAFTTAHDEAAADVALLREQLALIGDTLADSSGEATTAAEAGAPPGRDWAAPAGNRPEPGTGPALGAAAGPRRGADPGGPAPTPAVTPLERPGPGSSAGAGNPAAASSAVTPLERPVAGRSRTRRPLKVALGALAAAAAASVVVGMGWLVAQQPMGSSDDAGSKAAADSSAGEQDGGGVLFGSPRYLACARTVAEGTVSAVKPTPSGEVERVTLTVTRSYTSQDKKTELSFPIKTADQPRLHPGDLVLVGIPLRQQFPDTVLVGEENIAPERSRLTGSLPESRTLTCE
ncbi:hypothetical protein [Streptomyces sp. NPDC052012]|uniref:hypothetical protein n=1 Tax=Streptomyces sp. NPDC052012 TaxID=3155051 RepID=UPI00344D8A29